PGAQRRRVYPGGCRGQAAGPLRSEEHTSELQSRRDLVCRLLLEKKKKMREELPDNIPATFLQLEPGEISTVLIDYPGMLTLPTDLSLKTCTSLVERWWRADIERL